MKIGPTVANQSTSSFRFSKIVAPIVCIALAVLAFMAYVAIRARRTRATHELPLNNPQTRDIQDVQRKQLPVSSQRVTKNSEDSLPFGSSPSLSPSGPIVPPRNETTVLEEPGTTPKTDSVPESKVVEPISQEVIDDALGKIREGRYQEAAEGFVRGHQYEVEIILAATLRAIGKKMNEKDKVTPLGELKVKLATLTLVREMLLDGNLERRKRAANQGDIESMTSETFSRNIQALTGAMQYENIKMSCRTISTLKGAFALTVQSLQSTLMAQQKTLGTKVQASSLIALEVRIFDQFAQTCEEVVQLEETAIQERMCAFIAE